MKYNYELEVKFHEDTADLPTRGKYDGVMMMYDGEEILRKKQTETTMITLHSRQELTKEGLAKHLGENIPIISFKKME